MTGSNKLPIEDSPELLAEYGRAFAWINLVEYLLEQVIIFRAKVYLIDKEVGAKLMKGKMLGQKIELSKSLLKLDVIRDLELLNKKRVLLAHSAIAQEMHIAGEQSVKGDYVIGIGDKKQSLTIDFCKEIIILAQTISSKLHSAFTEGTNYPSGTEI